MSRLSRKGIFLREVNVGKYIYFNYFSKNIKRKGAGKIIPYRNAIIDLAADSKVIIGDKNLEIGCNKLRGSKTETYVRLRKGAVWNAGAGCRISYGATIELLEKAILNTRFFTMNSFSVMIAEKEVELGEDVMIARNVVVFDSDFHQIERGESRGEQVQTVSIGNHVWLGVNVTVLKGVRIADGSMVAANSVVINDIVSENVMVGNKHDTKILKEEVVWRRESRT